MGGKQVTDSEHQIATIRWHLLDELEPLMYTPLTSTYGINTNTDLIPSQNNRRKMKTTSRPVNKSKPTGHLIRVPKTY